MSTEKHSREKKPFLLGAIALFALLYLIFTINRTSPDTRSITTHAKLTSNQFVSLFDSVNPENIKSFVDKAIEIKGALKKVTYKEGKYTLFLTSNQKDRFVMCEMQDDQLLHINQYQPGDLIIIKGVFKGVLLDAILLNCIIVEKDNL